MYDLEQHTIDKDLVLRLLKSMNSREKTIVCARHGVGSGGCEMTYREIGEENGLTIEVVRNNYWRAILKARKAEAAISLPGGKKFREFQDRGIA